MKKQKIYIHPITKKIGHNQVSCQVLNDEDEKVVQDEPISIREQINALLDTNGYSFNIPLEITLDNHTYHDSIVALKKDRILTLNNHVIKLSDIKKIVRK